MSPEYGRRLLVNVIDERGSSDYPTPFAHLPRGTHPKDGFTEISYTRLSNAVDRCAWYLDTQIGKSMKFDTFAWLAHPLDLRYQILTLAATKIGWRAFFPSPRNSLQAHLSLLDQAECHVWLIDQSPDPVVKEIQSQRHVKLVKMPSLEDLLSETTKSPKYTYQKTFELARSDPVCVLHTSGSTGIPKIVVCKHTLFTVMDAFHELSKLGWQPFVWQHFEGMKAFMPFPNFHAAGLIVSIGANVWFNTVNVMAPLRPLTAELADSYHQYADITLSILPPSVLKDIATSAEYLEHLSNLKYVGNCGGPSTHEVGIALQQQTHPLNIIGITESIKASTLPTEMLDAEDYLYMRYSPCAGMEFRPVSDEYYEMVFKRNEALRDYQHIFNTFPDLDEWSSKDLYKKHPTKPDLWMYVGRSDDIIVFSNGEKLNPVTIEQKVNAHPLVTGVTMFGTGRFEAGLLIETQSAASINIPTENIRDEIWGTVQQINKETVAHGRVDKNMIVIVDRDKLFPRSGKGAIQRRLALNLYSKEIEEAYDAKDLLFEADPPELSSSDPDALAKGVQQWIQEQCGRQPPQYEEDLFNTELGFDSLLVMRLSHSINQTAKESLITPRTIYSNPTIRGIVESVINKRTGHNMRLDSISRENRMDSMLDKFTKDLKPYSIDYAQSLQQGIVIAVTGTTGTFGSYILDSLIRDRNVTKIYCLNRRENASAVQIDLQKSQSLSSDFSKVSFLTANLSQKHLALSSEGYRILREEVDVVIHNAWLVDFNIPLESFGSHHIHGLRELIDICAQSLKKACIFFVSSISTVEEWRPLATAAFQKQEPHVPEIDHDWSTSAALGYAESKHVGERLLAKASRELGIHVAICRVGQIAGPVGHGVNAGQWPEQEWIPSVIRTSVALKAFPGDLGALDRVEWIPVDMLGDIVSELVQNMTVSKGVNGKLQFYHAVNPHSTSWSALLPTIVEATLPKRSVSIVPFAEWVETLKSEVDTKGSSDLHAKGDYDELPAARLLSFFEAEAVASSEDPSKRKARPDTKNTRAQSPSLRALKAVSPEWMSMWMRQWGFAREIGKERKV